MFLGRRWMWSRVIENERIAEQAGGRVWIALGVRLGLVLDRRSV